MPAELRRGAGVLSSVAVGSRRVAGQVSGYVSPLRARAERTGQRDELLLRLRAARREVVTGGSLLEAVADGVRIESKLTPEPNTGCWLWTGATNGPGYGNLGVDGHNRVAHRIAYLLARGELPPGVEIDHRCRQPACCNPAHLEPVTHEENIRRGLHGELRTHCARGHDQRPRGARRPNGRCRACFNADMQLWREKRRAA